MATKYLDSAGVTYLWSKIKQYVGQITGNLFAYKKVTSGSTSISAADGLEEVAFEGGGSTTVTLTNQAATQGTDAKAIVTVTTPTKLSDFTADSDSQHFTQTEKTKLSGIATGAEVNQNAFSNVKVGSTTVAADSKTDTLELVAGDNVTLTPDATNDKVTIAATDTQRVVYTLVDSGNTYTIKDANNTTVQYEDFIDISLNSPDKNIILRYGTSEFIYAGGDEEGVEYYCITTNTVTKVAVTTSQVSTDFYTISSPYEAAPLMDGTASAGSSTSYAKGDHVHPKDTSKADKVSGATANNLAALDANGNLIDSGVSATSAGTDTKNTAGSTNDASKLFIVGAKSQAANPQTYSQTNAYITAGKVYSNAKEVVNLSDTQALTNKTYNGYTLAAASAKGVDTSITAGSTSTNLPTTAAVEARITSAIQTAQAGAAMYQGTAPTTFAPTNYKAGYYWIVGTAGTYAGQVCEPGDMIFANTDSATYSASHFDVIQTNLDIASMTNSEIDAAIAAA